MREILPGQLWIGNAGDLRDPAATLAHGVAAVVDLAASEPPAEVDASTRLGFRVADVRSVVAVLRSAGTPIIVEPKTGPWGMRAVVRDPDGRPVELFGRAGD